MSDEKIIDDEGNFHAQDEMVDLSGGALHDNTRM